MNAKKRRLSLISTTHYVKLFYRSALFLLALTMYVLGRVGGAEGMFRGYEKKPWVLALIWVVYAVEMICRFFPSRLESMGCQKQFRHNFRPTAATVPEKTPGWRILAVIGAWVALNGIIGALYFLHIIDRGILVLIALAYGVCDMICILFFCPFQTWFLKNRCCTVCRIYNWDFAMMFTPFLFMPSLYTGSLLIMSLALLARWELTAHFRPERFAENTNACLSCANCQEKLCQHKTQLHTFWKRNKARLLGRRK